MLMAIIQFTLISHNFFVSFNKNFIMENLNYKNEEWKDIPNYEGYQASNMGRIKSLEKIDARGNRRKEKILSPQINNSGYYRVTFCKQSIVKRYYVHRLVYETFNGQIPEGLQVNHINEIKTDNRLSNLNLMTLKENLNYGTRNERAGKVLKNGKCSKTVLQYDLQDNLIKEYPSIHQAYRETGFDYRHIIKCCKGKYKTAYGYKWRYK